MTSENPIPPPRAPGRLAYLEEAATPLGRWFMQGGTPEEASHAHGESRPWYLVLWLTGVDYFWTLG